MDDKKIFDVTPPKTPESIVAAKSARKIMLSDPQLKQDTSATPEIQETVENPVKTETAHTELNLSPLTQEPTTSTAPEVEKADSKPTKAKEADEPTEPVIETAVAAEPAEEPSDSATKQENTDKIDEVDENDEADEPEEEKTEVDELVPPEVADEVKDEPIKESASVDSILPDNSQRATASAKDAMQSPTMYDTKAYYVPIGNSQHRHGHVLGAIIAGLLTAAVAVGVVFAVAKFL